MSNKEFIGKVRNINPGRYNIRQSEICAILQYSESPVCNILDAFRYGFLKGQRAAKK